jgi:trehalose 6-phosphate synthase
MSLKEPFPSHLVANGRPECIIVSNRGPIEYYTEQDGQYKIRNGAGGVVTGLLGAIQQRPVVWIALTMTEVDRLGMQANQYISNSLPSTLANAVLRFLSVPQKTYDRHYYSICNRVLWFAQHSLLQPAMSTAFTRRTRDDWEKGYRVVNEALAEAVIRELKIWGPELPVIFQDYQLYLAPEQVRAHYQQARLSHVIYIPWPDARYLAMLPEYMVQAIYRSLSATDIIGFQTLHDARNFLIGATHFLKNAQVLWNTTNSLGILLWQGRRIQTCLYPIAPSPQHLHSVIQSPETETAIKELSSQISFNDNRKLILRVDRVDPTKNIIRGFQAYERLLQTHPELHGHVTFLALLVPSRENITVYRSYKRHVHNIINRINTLYGQAQWQPIVAIFGNNHGRALACLQYYDVLLVNPVIDGMNLVVKEGGILNKRSGVIILSRTAGAYDTIGNYVLGIAPLDIEATADALYYGLTMSSEERTHRAHMLGEALLKEDAICWLDMQIKDLKNHQ